MFKIFTGNLKKLFLFKNIIQYNVPKLEFDIK